MGIEELEEGEMEPFFADIEKFFGKTVALFGFCGWGDGRLMRDWDERTKVAGTKFCGEEGVICNETPDDEGLNACGQLARSLAASCQKIHVRSKLPFYEHQKGGFYA